MISHRKPPLDAARPYTPGRYGALLLMMLCLIAWSMGAFFYIRGIDDNIDLYFWYISPGDNMGTTSRFIIFFLVFFLVVAFPPLFFAPNIYQFNRPPTGSELLAYLFTFAGMTVAHMLFVVALAIAILRYRLWDIDLLIRRTLLYTLLSLTLALLYFGSVVVLETLLHGLTGQWQNQLVTVLSTLTIAALFTPLRRQMQAGIDRRFYRRKYNADQVLTAFGATVRDETNLEQLATKLMGVVDETLQPAHKALWLKPAPLAPRHYGELNKEEA